MTIWPLAGASKQLRVGVGGGLRSCQASFPHVNCKFSIAPRPRRQSTQQYSQSRSISGAGRLHHTQRCSRRVASQASSEAAPSGHARPGSFRNVTLRSRYDSDILNLAVPALFSIFLDPVMSLVDTALVGRLGTEALAAVGVSTMPIIFAAVVFNFLLFVTTPAVARAVARDDTEQASKVTARGIWLALILGTGLSIGMWFGSPSILSTFTKDPTVLKIAQPFLRSRVVAFPALLTFFAAAGSFRGWRDTRTPLIAAVLSNVSNFLLDLLFMFRFGWGATGAGLATTASQYVSAGVLVALLVKQGRLQPHHLRRLPPLDEALPVLKDGAALAVRNVTSMSVITYATSMVATLGPVTIASNEIMRQIYILCLQSFTALDIATQAMVATFLGKGDKASAKELIVRTVHLGLFIGTCLAAALLVMRGLLPSIFTSDAAVRTMVASFLPIIAFYMPLDGAACVMDGSLLGASETSYVSRAMIINSLINLGLLLLVTRKLSCSLGSIWFTLKLMTVGRIISSLLRFRSGKGPLGRVAEQVV